MRPETYSDILNLQGRTLIARGAGLSYCAASLSDEAVVVDMSQMNRILQFKPDEYFVEVEAGMAIGDLNNFLLEHGYCLSILPGYPAISVGGCVAFNIHGKSQFRSGTFFKIVEEIKLFHPSEGELICSEEINSSLFSLTLGGMGLTGLVVTVKLKIQDLPGGKMDIRRLPCKNIMDAIDIMQKEEVNHEHVYSWNNLNLRGEHFGMGFIYLENYREGSLKTSAYKNKLEFARDLPIAHNDITIRIMCKVYAILESIKSDHSVSNMNRACFPIYHKEIYFRLFGKNGFREYQMILPFEAASSAILEIEGAIQRHRVSPALGSLKLFRGERKWLRFDGEGVCLAMDLRNDPRTVQFFDELDTICKDHQAIVNISKDSRLNASVVSGLFEEYNLFKEGIRKFDKNGMIQSSLKKRLNL